MRRLQPSQLASCLLPPPKFACAFLGGRLLHIFFCRLRYSRQTAAWLDQDTQRHARLPTRRRVTHRSSPFPKHAARTLPAAAGQDRDGPALAANIWQDVNAPGRSPCRESRQNSRTPRDGRGTPQPTALPGTRRATPVQGLRSSALPLHASPQKCNTAFYLLVCTKNTAPTPPLPSPSETSPTAGPRVVCSVRMASRCRVRGLLHGHGGGPVDGLHHGGKPAAEVVGGVGPDLRGLLQHDDLGGAVEEPGQQLAQLHLQLCCQGREEETVSATATAKGPDGNGLRGRRLKSCDAFSGIISSAEKRPCPVGGDEQRLPTQGRRRATAGPGLVQPRVLPRAPRRGKLRRHQPSRDCATSHQGALPAPTTRCRAGR